MAVAGGLGPGKELIVSRRGLATVYLLIVSPDGFVVTNNLVQELTPDLARQLGLPPGTTGVVVSDVQPRTAVVEAGLRPGDVIQEVNCKAVTNMAEFQQSMRKTGSQSVLLLINRGGNTLYVLAEAN